MKKIDNQKLLKVIGGISWEVDFMGLPGTGLIGGTAIFNNRKDANDFQKSLDDSLYSSTISKSLLAPV